MTNTITQKEINFSSNQNKIISQKYGKLGDVLTAILEVNNALSSFKMYNVDIIKASAFKLIIKEIAHGGRALDLHNTSKFQKDMYSYYNENNEVNRMITKALNDCQYNTLAKIKIILRNFVNNVVETEHLTLS